MSRRIVVEALVVVVQLRAEELRAGSRRRRRAPSPACRPAPRPDAPPAEPVRRRAPTCREPPAARLGSTAEAEPPPGVRVVLDARPLQEPDRAPLTAAYLDGLLGGVRRRPARRASRSRSCSARTSTIRRPRFAGLDVVGRRLLPPTHLLRSAALTVDPFVLSGASVGAAWRAEPAARRASSITRSAGRSRSRPGCRSS